MTISYADGFLGQTMKNGTNGCAEAVGLMGAGNSQFLANEYNNGQYSVPGMVSDAQQAGIPVIPYQAGAANPNDVIVYGDNDHVVLSDGNGGYYGNSSSQNQIVHGSDATQMGGLQPTAIIKTGGQGGSFNFQAKDANGNPFINLAAKIRTSNPNEPFDQQSLMDILSQPTRSYAHEKRIHYLTDRDYQGDLLFLNPDVARWMKDSAKQLNDNRDADLKEQIDQANQQTRLKQAMQLAQLINGSGSVDNRRGYAAMAKMFGINLPTNDDQFVNSSDLLKTQVQMNNAERNYNFQQQQAKQAQDNWQKEFDLKKAIQERQADLAERKMALAAVAAHSGGGYRSGGGGYSGGGGSASSAALDKWAIEQEEKYAKDHPDAHYNEYSDMANAARDRMEQRLGVGFDPDDYNSAQNDWDNLLRQNEDWIANGDYHAMNWDALQTMAKARYGDMADNIIEGTDKDKFYFD